MRNVFLISVIISFVEFLNSNERCTDCTSWCIKNSRRISKLGSILYHPHTIIFCISLHAVNRDALEFAPTHGESERILGLQNMGVPPVLFDFYSHVGKASLLVLQTAQHDRVLRLKLSRELLRHRQLDLHVRSDLEVPVFLAQE